MLASGRPILAAVPPESEIGAIVADTGNGCVFGERELDGAVSFLTQLIRKAASGELTITPLPEYARPFSSDAMVRQFAELVDSLPHR